MIDDRVWLNAVRKVTGPGRRSAGHFADRGSSRNPASERDIQRALERMRGGRLELGRHRDESSPRRSNPQLQILGEYGPRRRNPGRATTNAVRNFHGATDGDLLAEYEIDDGNDEEIELAYLGHVPAISWLDDGQSGQRGLGDKQIDVDGELVRFHGHRRFFKGRQMPILALKIPTNEAVIVQGSVATLRDCCDDRGIFGFAPVVEYVVDSLKGSSKKDHHYVHEFAEDYEPVLRWDDSVNGLVYDRNRRLLDPQTRNNRAVYEVTDWFHEGDVRRHGDRS